MTPGSEPIVVVEDAPNWAPELLRQFPDRDVVSASPHEESGLPSIAASALTVVALGGIECAAWFARSYESMLSGEPRSPLLAVLKTADPTIEFALRELGATSVVNEREGRPAVLHACRRLLARSTSTF
jgi:hypothetical protein